MRDNRDDIEVAVPAYLDPRPAGRNAASSVDRRAVVAAGGQAGSLAGGVDAAHLCRQGDDTGQAQHQHHDQRGDRQCRFNSARTLTPRYTLVLSARLMMLVNADTTESPVTTV